VPTLKKEKMFSKLCSMLDLVIGIATDFGCLSKKFTDLTVGKLKSLQLKSFTVADAHLF